MLNITEKEIRKEWKKSDKPLVSICCLTYNHGLYISQALDGFLMQKTSFPFEIVIGEDCSTDNTRKVIEEYQKSFPNIIRIIETPENVGMHANFCRTHSACKAPYIAYCEGDDYWTDPNKLSIQIEFLESNKDYIISGTDAIIVNNNNEVIDKSKLSLAFGKDINKHPEIGDIWTLTMSAVYRNVVLGWPEEIKNVLNMDLFLQTILLKNGKRKHHADIKNCAYRCHDGGVWSGTDHKTKIDSSFKTHYWLYKYFDRTQQRSDKLKELKIMIGLFLKACVIRIPFSQLLIKHIQSCRLK